MKSKYNQFYYNSTTTWMVLEPGWRKLDLGSHCACFLLRHLKDFLPKTSNKFCVILDCSSP